jgi:two-component sensor histidine kinase
LSVNDSMPCALILTALITNAVKDGYPNGRRGRVTASIDDSDSGQ